MEHILATDTETTGLGPKDRAFGISWQLTTMEPQYVDLREEGPGRFLEDLDKAMKHGLRVVCHNASYDYRMAMNAGIELPLEQMDDTVIRATMINEHEFSYQLEDLAQKHLGRGKTKDIYEELAGMFGGRPTRAAQMPNLQRAPAETVGRYAAPDAGLAHDLWQFQQKEIKRQGIEDICAFERRVMPSIIRNEMMGVRVDVEAAERAVEQLTITIDAQTKQLYEIAGSKFNVNSSTDVARLFNPRQLDDGSWVTEDGKPIASTPGGKASFSAESLREINNVLSNAIIDVRSMIKTRDTFLRGHILGNQIDGRVYPSIHQTKGEDGGTGTGRFSYREPALQQIPSRNKAVASIIKPIFLPDEGQVWVDADMHSFEVRVFAHLVNNEDILAMYMRDRGMDFHQAVAELTGLVRNATYSGQPNAKQLNLSMIFNSGNGAIAEKMGMPFEWASFQRRDGTVVRYKKAGPEAEEVIAHYHRMLPGVKRLAERATKKAKALGYIETEYGRRFRFPKGEFAYKASGICIQATAADINKHNWMIIEQALEGQGRLVLNTHDSYGLSLPEDWKPHWDKVKKAVEGGFPWFRVPIVLELSGAGPNWWAALEH